MIVHAHPRSGPFRFGLGHVSLEFAATLAGRHGEQTERLATAADLAHWLHQAGLARDARCDARLLTDARALREAVYRTIERTRGGHRPSPADVELINAWARRTVPVPQLGPRGERTSTGPEPAPAALAQLARETIELVTGPLVARIRNCANPTCSLLFIDHSRPGRRRWCSMERCGNRAKTAHYRERKRASRA